MRAGNAAVLGTCVLIACGYPFGPCISEHIEVAQTATMDRGAGPESFDGAGQVAPGNTADFDALRAFLIDGGSIAGRQVVWTVNTGTGYLAVFLPGSVRSGDVVAVSAIVGGGWGLATASAGAAVSLRDGDFQAATASGTITVESTRPLRIRFDIIASDAAGEGRSLSGVMQFAYSRTRTRCD